MNNCHICPIKRIASNSIFIEVKWPSLLPQIKCATLLEKIFHKYFLVGHYRNSLLFCSPETFD
jgi:hypothetical protein